MKKISKTEAEDKFREAVALMDEVGFKVPEIYRIFGYALDAIAGYGGESANAVADAMEER